MALNRPEIFMYLKYSVSRGVWWIRLSGLLKYHGLWQTHWYSRYGFWHCETRHRIVIWVALDCTPMSQETDNLNANHFWFPMQVAFWILKKNISTMLFKNISNFSQRTPSFILLPSPVMFLSSLIYSHLPLFSPKFIAQSFESMCDLESLKYYSVEIPFIPQTFSVLIDSLWA